MVAVDDVYKAIGVENADRYTKSLYELIDHLHRAYGASSVLIVATTSEGVSKRLLPRHTYTHVYMVWNLDRRGFEELAEQLSPPLALDELWSLTGGNPRALVELAALSWNKQLWLDYLAERRVEPAVRLVGVERLRALVEDPDSGPEAASVLEEQGLMIELTRSLTLSPPPPRDLELGIGSRWAWQLPAYRVAAKRLLNG